MHPILASRDRLVLYLVAWIPVSALLTGILARGTDISAIEGLAIAGPMCAFYAFICLAAWYICRAVPIQTRSIFNVVGTLTASTLCFSLIWVVVGRSWVATLENFPPFAGAVARYTGQAAILFLAGIFLFLLAIVVHYLLIVIEQSRLVEKRALELQVLAREAELRALRAQIDPHFLFNSLNSISALALAEPHAARRMCLLLADFMRSALALGGRSRVSFAEEIKLTRNFLEIETVRFGSRLSVSLDIEPTCNDCLMPPLLLQPLVENAVKHGIGPLLEGGTIVVKGRRSGADVELVLENPFDEEQVRPEGTGLGIRNVRERLANVFGSDASLNIERGQGRFRVVLKLPCSR